MDFEVRNELVVILADSWHDPSAASGFRSANLQYCVETVLRSSGIKQAPCLGAFLYPIISKLIVDLPTSPYLS